MGGSVSAGGSRSKGSFYMKEGNSVEEMVERPHELEQHERKGKLLGEEGSSAGALNHHHQQQQQQHQQQHQHLEVLDVSWCELAMQLFFHQVKLGFQVRMAGL
jgi:hypothetical protein